MNGISLDYRTGSKELAPLFLPYGVQVKLRELEFGDIAFGGNGPHGECAVAIERKRIDDLVASIETKRLSGHQLPGMADTYDYCYLIVEGVWRPSVEGQMQIGLGDFSREGTFGGRWYPHRRRLSYRAVDNYLATLELHAGVICRRTLSPEETVAMTVDLWRWWGEKKWSQHSSHLAVYAPARDGGRGRLQLAKRDVPLAELWAMQLDEIDRKARIVASHFGSARALANATIPQWMEIKGIGKITATKAVEAINAEL